MKGLAFLRGGAKQAAFGSDVSPKVLILAGMQSANPVFNNIFVGEEELSTIKTQVFPNPAQTHFTILNQAASTLIIYDLIGQVVLQKQLMQAAEHINIEHLAPGIYTIQFGSLTEKLIKN